MAVQTKKGDNTALLSAVALLGDLPQHRLVRGQVGAVVEPLDETTALVAFSDDKGHAYAIVPCLRDALLGFAHGASGRIVCAAQRSGSTI
jgi:hypothetical protein